MCCKHSQENWGFSLKFNYKRLRQAEMSIFLIELDIYLVDFDFMIHRFSTRT